jgi:two-component system response regulator ChvI
VHHFCTAGAFLAVLDDVITTADAILLDWQLEKSRGLGLLVTLRRRGIRLPVIFVTSFATVDHEKEAFDKGATDFVDKCRGVETLVRRLELAIAADALAHGPSSGSPECDERLTLCRRFSRVAWRGIDIELTRGEFDMLELLVVNAGAYVRYDSLYAVYHAARCTAPAVTVNVRSTIKRIRNHFRAVDPEFAEIESYAGFGYRWRA